MDSKNMPDYGSWHQTHNLMSRDIRGKVELSVQQTIPQRSGNKIISISKIEKSENIVKVFKRNERDTKNQKTKSQNYYSKANITYVNEKEGEHHYASLRK